MVPILKVENLCKSFGGLKAIHQLDFEVPQGQIYGIIGPNGAGKSTLFNCLTGMFPIDDGNILYENEHIHHLKTHQIVRKGLVKTFQANRMFAQLPVWKNLLIGYDCRSGASTPSQILGTRRSRQTHSRALQAVEEVLHFVGLSREKELLARNLPHGSQRKLAIAIALLTGPKLLLLDEPATGMNPEEKGTMVDLIGKINGKGITILLIEHDMKMVMNICEHILVINYGEKIAQGKPEEVSKNKAVIEAYLGKGGSIF
jgi:branched-chain amino acid transport system ATP-binding protein